MQEVWKDIPDYEGLYQVSNLGNVKSLFRYCKVLKPHIDKDGYLRVRLYKNKKNIYIGVHKCVAKAFIPNPNNLPEVNHKNEIRSDNRVDNLEWCTNWYNIHYGNAIIKSQLSRSKKILQFDLQNNLICEYESLSIAGKITNISISNISKVCNGERKQAGGYIWKYTN